MNIDNLISLQGLDKGAVLAALYNNSRQQGLGFLNPRGRDVMTPEQGNALLKEGAYFDYLHGRVMKVDLSGDALDPRLYDRDNGRGAAAKAIAEVVSRAKVL